MSEILQNEPRYYKARSDDETCYWCASSGTSVIQAMYWIRAAIALNKEVTVSPMDATEIKNCMMLLKERFNGNPCMPRHSIFCPYQGVITTQYKNVRRMAVELSGNEINA